MFIHEFTVRNFLIHSRSTIAPRPLTVLVGPNGGGKSALFDAMLNFSMLARGNIRQAFGPFPFSFAAKLSHASLPPRRIGFEVELSKSYEDPCRVRYKIDYAQSFPPVPGGAPGFFIFTERLSKGGAVIFDREDPGDSPLKSAVRLIENDRGIFAAIRQAHMAGESADLDPVLLYLAQSISRFNKFRLNPHTMAFPSYLPSASAGDSPKPIPPVRLGYEGEDLHSLLFWLSENKHPALDVIEQEVAASIDGFQAFEFDTVGTEKIAFSVRFGDERGAVPAANLSHGMLMFIGLIALVASPNRPPVLFIEEPENGLTPRSTLAFYRTVRALAYGGREGEQSQVFISSHSPFVICCAWNGDDRSFIHQVHVRDGRAEILPFPKWVQDTGVHLQKDKSGERTILSLRLADQLMSDYGPSDVPCES